MKAFGTSLMRGTGAAFIAAALGWLSNTAADAAELTVITNQGTTPEVRELAAAFMRASNHKVAVIQEGAPELDKRLAAGGPADLIATNPPQVADLTKKNQLMTETVTPFAMAGLGVSVRAGAPKPDISTVEAYSAALIAAKSIGYSHGCSGTHAADGIAKLGLSEQLKSKTVYSDNGPVVEFLAKGAFELGIQQTNIMVGAPGTDYVGAPPGFLNMPCPSSVVLFKGTKVPEAARELLRFMVSPEAAPLLRKTFVEPAKL
jgi:molybdate transport system substrate-binding protein